MKDLYSWSYKNIYKFIFIIFVIFIILLDGVLIYSHRYMLDEDNPQIETNIPFMKVIQYGYYLVSKQTISKVKQFNETLFIKSREDLYNQLIEKNISHQDATNIILLLKKSLNFKNINLSAGILVSYTSSPRWQNNIISKIKIFLKDKEQVIIENNNGNFSYQITTQEITEHIVHKRIILAKAITESIINNGVPKNIEKIVTRSLSWDLDLTKEVRSDDKLDIIYTCNYNQFGKVLDCNKLLYVSFKGVKKSITFYNYKNDYYYLNGKSVAKMLIKTPLDNVRLTSPFGVRFHPVLGYSIFHTGNDFGGKTGTPIYASGDGVVTKVYTSSSYGLYITIKHNDHVRTAYAHLSKFAPDLKVGTKVKQYQVIGYIGSTGRATGPHLHFEVLIDGKPVNSLSMDSPSKTVLEGEELVSFTKYQKIFEDKVLKNLNKPSLTTNIKQIFPLPLLYN